MIGPVLLLAVQTVPVGEASGWALFRGNGTCIAVTRYGQDMRVGVGHDLARNRAVLAIHRPIWRSVEPGREYSISIAFSNGRSYDNAPAEGDVQQDGDEQLSGVNVFLVGDEFLEDFAAANWMQIKLGDTLIASLNLQGTRHMVRRIVECAAVAFRESPRDPFADVPASPTAEESSPRRYSPNEPARQTGGSISDADYPAQALREGAAGTTRVSILVSASGQVGGCAVTGSSGHAALDFATCTLIRRRFRYSPATDGQGRPVTATISRSVTWRPPRD